MKKIILFFVFSCSAVFSNTSMDFLLTPTDPQCREIVDGSRNLGKICVWVDLDEKKLYADYFAYDGYVLINAKFWAGNEEDPIPTKPNQFLVNDFLLFDKPKTHRIELDITDFDFECDKVIKVLTQAIYTFEQKEKCCVIKFPSDIEVFNVVQECPGGGGGGGGGGGDGGGTIEGCETAVARPNCPFPSGMEFDEDCQGGVFDGSDFTSLLTFPPSNRWGWEIQFPPPIPYPQGMEQTYKLYAGAGQNDTSKGTWVGNVIVDYTDVNVLKVTTEMLNGNFLKTTHVSAGVVHTGTTSFGKWPSQHEEGELTPSDELDIYILNNLVSEWDGNSVEDIVALPQPTPFYIDVHAEVCGPGER